MTTQTDTHKSFISYRKTQRGDWLIFEAVPYQLALAQKSDAINRNAVKTNGYTTGTQYGRAKNETEAREKALALAELKNQQPGIWEYSVIEWEYPTVEPFQTVTDLPKLYPTETKFASFTEAEAAGWIYLRPDRFLAEHRGYAVYVADVTAGRSFGYDLVISIRTADRTPIDVQFAKSVEIWATDEGAMTAGKFSPRFRAGDILDGIEEGKRHIDKLMGYDYTATERAKRRRDVLKIKAGELGFDSLSAMLTAWKNGDIELVVERK